MAAMAWSEEKLLDWLRTRPGNSSGVTVGSRGHDAAVLRATGDRTVLCTDQTIEGVHFEPGTSASAVGRKAAARALSDLAATAARPVALLLALRAPRATPEAWIRRAIRAVERTAAAHGAELVGGDLAAAPGRLALTVTAQGRLAGRKRPPGRDRARAGDLVLLTGPVGGSRLGRHLSFEPRLAEGAWLHARGAAVLMDVSDGLARDLARIARASAVRIEIDDVPLHADARRAARASGRSALRHALEDGEDHELIATLPAADWRRIRSAAVRRFPELCPIGRVLSGNGLWLPDPGADDAAHVAWSGRGGWTHGA
jgi:thiamine-monophosphate kinase